MTETETTLLHYVEHPPQLNPAEDLRLQKDLENRLRHLQAILPTERYERLMDIILGSSNRMPMPLRPKPLDVEREPYQQPEGCQDGSRGLDPRAVFLG